MIGTKVTVDVDFKPVQAEVVGSYSEKHPLVSVYQIERVDGKFAWVYANEIKR